MKQPPRPDMYQMDDPDVIEPRPPASWCEITLAVLAFTAWGWMVIPAVHYFLNQLIADAGWW